MSSLLVAVVLTEVPSVASQLSVRVGSIPPFVGSSAEEL